MPGYLENKNQTLFGMCVHMCMCVRVCECIINKTVAIYPGVNSYLQVGEWDFHRAIRGTVSFYLYPHLDYLNFSKVYNENSNSTAHKKGEATKSAARGVGGSVHSQMTSGQTQLMAVSLRDQGSTQTGGPDSHRPIPIHLGLRARKPLPPPLSITHSRA